MEGGTIPRRHTGEAVDVSPPLVWMDVPEGARSFALTVTDPDAPKGTWTHWLLFDLPPGARALAQEIPRAHLVLGGARQGKNSWNRIGWNGPMPPPGAAHRYEFRLFALDGPLGCTPGSTRAEIEAAMQGHILAEARLTGLYAR